MMTSVQPSPRFGKFILAKGLRQEISEPKFNELRSEAHARELTIDKLDKAGYHIAVSASGIRDIFVRIFKTVVGEDGASREESLVGACFKMDTPMWKERKLVEDALKLAEAVRVIDQDPAQRAAVFQGVREPKLPENLREMLQVSMGGGEA